MTTSNSTNWELTRDNMIERSLRILGVLAQGASANSTQLSTGQTALNGVIARFNTLGMPLWKRTEASVTLINGTDTYTIANAIKMAEVYVRVTGSSNTWKLEPKSEYDMRSLPYTNIGVPVSWSFTPNLAEGGTIRVWPIPDATTAAAYTLRIIYQKEFDTFTSGSETMDFPAYWTDAIVFELATVLAPEYGIPLKDRTDIQAKAMMYLNQAKGYSDEDGSIFFAPARRR